MLFIIRCVDYCRVVRGNCGICLPEKLQHVIWKHVHVSLYSFEQVIADFEKTPTFKMEVNWDSFVVKTIFNLLEDWNRFHIKKQITPKEKTTSLVNPPIRNLSAYSQFVTDYLILLFMIKSPYSPLEVYLYFHSLRYQD